MALPHMTTSYTTRKNIYEAAIVRRRNHENDFREHWKDSARYFERADVEANKQSAWTSEQSYSDSMQSYKLQYMTDNRAVNLKRRRLKLSDLLQKEKDQFEAELKGLSHDNYSRLEDMKERSESLKSAREEKRKQTADEKLVEHFRKNNPDLRELESRQHEQFVINEWSDQVDQQRQREEDAKMAKEEYEQQLEIDRQRALDEECKQEAKKIEEEKKMKDILKQQVQELRNKEREAEELKAEQESLLEQQWQLEQLEEQRKFREEQRKKLQFGRVLLRQHKSSLMRKSKQIQEELEIDRQVLMSLLKVEDHDLEVQTARKEKARADAAWMKEVIEDQLKLEKSREAELDMLYQDEAARVWQKREEEWQQERLARQRLMNEVLEGRQNQIQDKMVEVGKQQQESLERREELLQQLEVNEQLTRREQEEDERSKVERKQQLIAQMTARQHQKEASLDKLHDELADDQKAAQDYDEMLQRETQRMNLHGFQPQSYRKGQGRGKPPSHGGTSRQAWM